MCRKHVAGCDTIGFEKVTARNETIPDISGSSNLILKPALGVSSIGIHAVSPGQESPYLGLEDPCGMINFETSFIDKDCRDAAGIVEEYVDWSYKRVSCDCYLFDGKTYPFSIADNVYCKDNLEVFDHLMVPTQDLTEQEQDACWRQMDIICGSLHEKYGMDNQFICTEFFVKGDEAHVMEVNPRISANQAPCFRRVFENGCAVEAMIWLQLGVCPERPVHRPDVYGVSLYKGRIHGRTVPEIEHVGTDLTWYDRLDKDAHVYSYGPDPTAIIAAGNEFYNRLKSEHESS